MSDQIDRTDGNADVDAGRQRFPWSTVSRYLRFLLALGILGWYLIGQTHGGMRECVERMDTSSSGEITTSLTCSPLTLTSAPLVLLLLAMIILAWPELSEFSGFGLTLKRRVEEVRATARQAQEVAGTARESAIAAKSQAEGVRDDVAVLKEMISFQLTQIRNSMISNQSNSTTINVRSHRLSQQDKDLLHNRAEVIRSSRTRGFSALEVTSEMGLEFLKKYAELREILDGVQNAAQGTAPEEQGKCGAIESFEDGHCLDLRLVAAVREAVIRGEDVSPGEELLDAMTLVDELLGAANRILNATEA